MAKRLYKVGDTFRPYGIDTTGNIIGVIKTKDGNVYTWNYSHNPEASYSGNLKELNAIIGVK